MPESGLARLVECNFVMIGCVHQLLGLALEMQIAPKLVSMATEKKRGGMGSMDMDR